MESSQQATDAIVVHTADFVVPVVSEPIVRGAVAVGDGRIVAVGVDSEVVADYPGARVVRWPGAMIPGLVNAHTHLQLTEFDQLGQLNHSDYVSWSRAFAEYCREQDTDEVGAGIRAGVARSLTYGVTCFADILTEWPAAGTLAELEIPGVTFLELIDIDQSGWLGGMRDALLDTIDVTPSTAATKVGVSPHAPYTVNATTLRSIAETSRQFGLRMHVHVGESQFEDEFYRTGTGPLAERIRAVSRREMEVLDQGGTGLGTAEFVESLGLLGHDSHFAHAVYLDDAGRRRVSDAGTYVALCPRSNLAVGANPPPFADYLRDGARIAVGTDSLTSAPTLDLLDDVAVLRQLAFDGDWDGEERELDRRLLEIATIEGARAIGLDGELGSLEVGKRADLAIFDLPAATRKIEATIVQHATSRCVATLVGGVLRWSAAALHTTNRHPDIP